MSEWYKYWEDADRTIVVYNKQETAVCLRVSLKTIDTWITKGAPVYERGANGQSYKIDIVAFVEWSRSYRLGVSVEELRRRDERDPMQHALRALFAQEIEIAALQKAAGGGR
jgi:phage terminase Nu1 subunit (DNA packaging protein)